MLLALVLGTVCALGVKALGLPLPWLMGPLLVTSAAAIGGWKPFGHTLGVPTGARLVAIPVLGVAIGGAFTPDILASAGRWWPSVLALAVYIPLAQIIGFRLARRISTIDPATAFYGTMPGGLIESAVLGEAAGADLALLMMMQFMRLLICLVVIPVGFSLYQGAPVGSAAGVVLGGAAHVLTPQDWVLLAVAGAVGATVGGLLRLPAYVITGPIIASAAVHLAGWVQGGPPWWLVAGVQVVVGANLGVRFAGRSPRVILTAARIAGVTVTATLVLAVLFAVLLHRAVGESWEAVFLAFAPGGLTEMSLIALSMQISVIYVTLHHVVRILLTVTVARVLGPAAIRNG